MDAEAKVEMIKSFAEEVMTEEELLNLFRTKDHPLAYDGFEPSGLAHLPVGVYRPIILEKLLKTGVKFKLLLADTFAWINKKLGGEIEKIREAGEYFIEVWKAAGVDMGKVEIVWHKQLFDCPEYWKKVILIARKTNLSRATRALTVAGRSESKQIPTALLFYPVMQCADVFQLEVDICQLGIDQRKVNVLAREVAPLLGFKKPVVVHHPLLLSLKGRDKMSKSIPDSAIFVHDSEEEIKRKIRRAFCPKSIENNPVIELVEKIIFNKFDEFVIDEKDSSFGSARELKEAYASGNIPPLELKNAVAEYINQIVKPIREHFEKKRRARELYRNVRAMRITR